MVTVELAASLLAALFVLLLLCWGIWLVALQVVLIDAAGEVARQAARGDDAAVRAAQAQAPVGTRFTVRGGVTTVVTVRLEAAPLARGLPRVSLQSQAKVLTEPGARR
jgi:hypothetical protein